MKLILSLTIALIFCSAPSEAQTISIRKTALLVQIYGGKHKVLPKDSIKPEPLPVPGQPYTFKVGHAGDAYSIIVLPFEKKALIDVYMRDLHTKHEPYFYNDIFVTGIIDPPANDRLQEMKIDPVAFSELPKISFQDLNRSNTTYLAIDSIGAVCKAWTIDADWDMRIINYRPKYLNGIAPSTLNFDHYFIHTLSKIHSITSLDKLDEGSVTKIYKEGLLK